MNARLWKKVSFLVLSCALVLAGVGVLWMYPHDWPQRELAVSVSHALMVAGILALTVDRYVKHRLLKELATDVSKYLIGYELPREVQDRIHDIMATSVIRFNYEQRYRLFEDTDGEIKAEVQLSYDVENWSGTPRWYTPELHFGKHERATVVEVGCHTTDTEAQFLLSGGALRPYIREDGDSLRLSGRDIAIQPRSRGVKYRIFQKYFLKPPVPLDITAFAKPTIGVTVIVDHPENLRCSLEAMAPTTIQIGTRWELRQLFMPGEHITLKWEKLH
jgi:hypothetical protein